jgi:uracil phosphoribosyltransferase
LEICPEALVGKILIQRNEETAQPMLYYLKLPPLHDKTVVILDPMIATGGSAICALQVLVDNGASPEKMFFFNVVSCPEGLTAVTSAFPGLWGLIVCVLMPPLLQIFG